MSKQALHIRCLDCGHEYDLEPIRVVNGSRYFGSDADHCEKCESMNLEDNSGVEGMVLTSEESPTLMNEHEEGQGEQEDLSVYGVTDMPHFKRSECMVQVPNEKYPTSEFIPVNEYALALESELRTLREALQALYDEQNGPPLEMRREAWESAMERARVLLITES